MNETKASRDTLSTAIPKRGAAYWLWEEEQEVRRGIERQTGDIEGFEAKIVAARQKRQDLTLVAIEMAAARQLIESAGLKVEMRDGMPYVEIEKVLTAPEPDDGPILPSEFPDIDKAWKATQEIEDRIDSDLPTGYIGEFR